MRHTFVCLETLFLEEAFPLDMLESGEFRPEELAEFELGGEDTNMKEENLLCRRLLSVLSPKRRRVIEMMFFEGFSADEVAEEMQTSITKIATCLADSFQQMRDSLKTHSVVGGGLRPPLQQTEQQVH
jgi:DNA-directed RNA polymerase specialized sigma24 family protein